MKFTKNNISNRSLRSYLLNNCTPVSHRQEKGHCVSVYDSIKSIENLEAKIKRHKDDTRYNKHRPLWENHIKILNELS